MLLLFASGLLLLARFGTLNHPSLFVIIWWCLWMAVAGINLAGLDRPSDETWLLFFTMIGSFAIGSLLPSPQAEFVPYNTNDGVSAFNHKIFFPFLIVALPVLGFYVWKARKIISGLPAGANRAMLIDMQGGENILTGSTFVRNMLEVGFAGPLLYFSLFGVIYFARDRKIMIPLGTALLIVMYQSFELGRSQIYRLVVLAGMAAVLIWPRLSRSQKAHLSIFGGAGLLVLVVMMQLSTGERHETNANHDINDSVLEFVSYHTVGFTLFDAALSDKNSPVNGELGFGRATVAGSGVIISNILKFVLPPYQPFRYTYLDYTDAFQDLGARYSNGQPAYYNSYYTILFPLYIDGRWFAVIIIPLLLGLICSHYFARWKASEDDLDLAISLFIAICMAMGVFQSPTERTYTYVGLAILIGVRIFSKRLQRKATEDRGVSEEAP